MFSRSSVLSKFVSSASSRKLTCSISFSSLKVHLLPSINALLFFNSITFFLLLTSHFHIVTLFRSYTSLFISEDTHTFRSQNPIPIITTKSPPQRPISISLKLHYLSKRSYLYYTNPFSRQIPHSFYFSISSHCPTLHISKV